MFKHNNRKKNIVEEINKSFITLETFVYLLFNIQVYFMYSTIVLIINCAKQHIN